MDPLSEMLDSILDKRPKLKELNSDQTILEYLRPAVEWKQQKDIFPYTDLLSEVITSGIEGLYGKNLAKKAKKQLESSWVVETGAHLHIPRRYEKVLYTEGPQINSLLFQGQILWALANKALGNDLSISLNSGRVPLDNTNSGAYLDLPGLKTPMPLMSKKRYPEAPQSFIPAASKIDIKRKMELLAAYRQSRNLPEHQYLLGMEVLKNFLKVQSNFSDQVCTTHALMLNKVSPIKQITLDSEFVGRDFILPLLEDKKSLMYKIFNTPGLREKFIISFANIRTGWVLGVGTPFHSIIEVDGELRLANYNGNLDPATLIKGLKNRTLWPTGVLKFFVMMAEAGMLPTGGWTQSVYCSDIKAQAIKFLEELSLTERAKVLQQMPTYIAAVAPCWGIDEIGGHLQLLDAMTPILDPASVDLSQIINLTCDQTLLVAMPTLYEFILGEPPSLNYDDLEDNLQFALRPIKETKL